jgi:ergothioneine biosynthesis protein EgtB
MSIDMKRAGAESETAPLLTRAALTARYREVRGLTEHLCAPLSVEDYVVQSMPEASPAKWHLAHTSWFFETFLLGPHLPGYRPFSPQYSFLFNSYYNAVGERVSRAQRGLLSRPPVDEVYRYRAFVDEHMGRVLEETDEERFSQLRPILVLGLHHEQQHQELLLTDLKHLLGCNPLRPAYQDRHTDAANPAPPLFWARHRRGLRWIGHAGPEFAFDNEGPRHQVFLRDFQIASRPVTNGEYLAFMAAGGYDRPEFWLSDGWNACRLQAWRSPLYWEESAAGWRTFTLAGMRDVIEAEPVCHVSYYEADAFARWAGARLPAEAEWETAAPCSPLAGNFLDRRRLHPVPPAQDDHGLAQQFFGDVWEWTASPYTAYPGYAPAPGALGEYNAKFMCNQMVLRGGSCVTPPGHMRRTYRNFFPPETRWQFTGIRLAKDL